jgi:3-oxoacyl-[acyl-carrier-protein] synthase-3
VSQVPYSAVVRAVASAVPEKVVTNADLEKLVDTTDDWIVSRTGIKERRVLAENQSTSDIACEAAQKAMEKAGVTPEQIGLVIVATFTPDYVFPATSCLVQDRLGCKNAAAFDLNAACSGFIYGLTVAAQFVQTGFYEHVLMIGADANSRLVDWQDRGTCVIFGDGASAVVVSRSTNHDRGVRASYMRADGSGWKHLHQPAGGAKRPPTVETVRDRLHHIKMDGKETFKFAARAMSEAANEACKRAGLDLAAIDLVVPHQANIRIIDAACSRMGIQPERVVINIDRYGNTVAASVGLALDEAVQQGRVKEGDNLLLLGFGAGLTWGGLVLNWGC